MMIRIEEQQQASKREEKSSFVCSFVRSKERRSNRILRDAQRS